MIHRLFVGVVLVAILLTQIVPLDAQTRVRLRHVSAGCSGAADSWNTHTLDHHGSIPDRVATPNIIAVQNGNWSAACTWNLGRAPIAGDKVWIPSGKSVTYGANSTALLTALGIDGS